MEHKPIPLQFQLLYNWESDTKYDDALSPKHRTRMYSTFKVDLNEIPIYRLIHYDFERHHISAGQLFKACGLTLIEGFFLFEIKLTEFEVDFLIPQFPFCDIWISVEQARAIAVSFGVEDELALLLSEGLDECYSTDNMNRNEIMHNWSVPSIPNLQYSTRALLEATFDVVEILSPTNRKIRTQISRSKQPGMVMKDRAAAGIVRWQVWAYEQFLQKNNNNEDEVVSTLDRSGAVWDSLQGILSDLQTLGRGGQVNPVRVLSDTMMVGNMPLKKDYLGHSLYLQQLYIAVMAEKVTNEMSRLLPHKGDITQEKISSSETALTSSSSIVDVTMDNNMQFHDRMDLLEQELYKLKRKMKKKHEEIERQEDELIQEMTELRGWKIQSERKRKSERVWMLLVMSCVIFGIVSLQPLFGDWRTLYF
ncbi:hypothetical protein BDB01DRAFT_809178 [Pilobolus umbonatus]|nr:hypothetical protein BDB01DRAFT_809178 [Pilobolus umbonatus]